MTINPNDGVYNHNLHSIQELMRANEMADIKFKHVCADFPHLFMLTKSIDPGKVQVTLFHSTVTKNPLGEIIVALPMRYPPNHQRLSQLTPSAHSRALETISTSRSRRFSFALSSETSRGQIISTTG